MKKKKPKIEKKLHPWRQCPLGEHWIVTHQKKVYSGLKLRDFLIDIDQKDAIDPNLNICAGVRWLFHKKKLLEHKLKRSASSQEAVMEYKSYTKELKLGAKKKEHIKALRATEKI